LVSYLSASWPVRKPFSNHHRRIFDTSGEPRIATARVKTTNAHHSELSPKEQQGVAIRTVAKAKQTLVWSD